MASLFEQADVNYEVGRLYVNGSLTVPHDVAERIAKVLCEPVPALFRAEDVRDAERVAV